MSTNNSFYRYKIAELNDISESTYSRRLSKASQNNKKSLFFEIKKNFKPTQLAVNFLSSKLRDHDCILSSPDYYYLLSNKISSKVCILNISEPSDLKLFCTFGANSTDKKNILFTPTTDADLNCFVDFQKSNSNKYHFFWSFTPYNPQLKNSLTVKAINKHAVIYNKIAGLDIFNTKIPAHYELEPTTNTSYKINWSFSLKNSLPEISVIIPTYNNVQFLSNVIWHLINQKTPKEYYEIIIADDGSQDKSSEIIHSLLEKFKDQINIKYIYWSKSHPLRGEQQFFRSGLVRNLATRYSLGKFLLFLDSDMLTPENFINKCLTELQTNDIIQFQRFHINQELSKINPAYNNITLKTDTYIEEKQYWSELFFCENWSDLPNYWKYTCTYALGIKKDKFLEMGLFKKYYISYGFEDTDIGYEAFKKNYKFKFIKIPLLHLTAYDKMQYRNSFSKRFKLLSVTAELLYLQHLDKDIYNLFGNYYRAQKPIKSFIRDLL